MEMLLPDSRRGVVLQKRKSTSKVALFVALSTRVFLFWLLLEFCVRNHFFWLFLKVCFLFGLWFGFCLVVVVVVAAFFQHGCGTKTNGCGKETLGCGNES
jgi:hypothetical protein